MPDLLDRLSTALADRYTIERELGRGGMAVVYLAHDQKLDRPVALKVLRPELAASLGGDRFLREIEIAAKLAHPNILALHDCGEADGILYYVMPYVEGESLRDWLNREKQLPVEDAIQVTREVGDALSYAHSMGVIHRDIKPENILFQAGHAVVADFGIARAVSAASGERLTETGLAIGTPAYMSPEQAAGVKEIDARTDIYSLGCLLYEMIGGEPPFTGPTPQAVLARHSMEQVPSLTIIRPAAPENVQRAIEKALGKQPADRYRTAEKFIEALSQPAAEIPAAQPSRRVQWKRIRLAIGALVALSILALAVYRFWPAADAGDAGLVEGRVAVFPFDESGEVEGQLDGEAIANMLGIMVGATARYQHVPLSVVKQSTSASCGGTLGPVCVSRAAAKLGASLYVTGGVTALRGDTVSILAQMFDLTGTRGYEPITVRGSSSEPQALLDSLYRKVWVAPTGEGERLIRAAEVTSASADALLAFLDGEQYLLEWDLRSADASYRRAVETDSAFALAWYRIAFVANWRNTFDSALAAIDRAQALADRLSTHDQLLLAALRALLQGAADEGEDLYLQILAEDPNDVEALNELAELYAAYNWRRGRSMAEAVDPARRALALQPGHPFAGEWLVKGLSVSATIDTRFDEMDSIVRGEGDSLAVAAVRAILAQHEGDRAPLREVVAAVTPIPPLQHPPSTHYQELMFQGTLHDDVASLALLGTIMDPWTDSVALADYCRTRQRQRYCLSASKQHVNLRRAAYEWGQGRFGAAASALSALESSEYVLATAFQALFVTLPLVESSDSELQAIRASLEAWRADSALPSDWQRSGINTSWSLGPQVRLYLLGLVSARLGESAAALEHARQLESLPCPWHAPTASQDLAQGVRAEVFWQRGRMQDALDALEAAPRNAYYQEAWDSPFVVSERDIFLQAMVLDSLGRHDEAIPWYAYVPENAFFLHAALLAPSHLYRGEIHEELGDRARAIRHYNAFVELWQDADPEYRGLVDDVRGRIVRLGG